MSAPALALIPVLTDTGTGTGASTRTLRRRAARPRRPRRLRPVAARHPGRRGMRPADPAARHHPRHRPRHRRESCTPSTPSDTPDGVIYLPCGDRRASVCPPCAETYRADTYQLIRAGLAGGKGMPESVAIHPCVFATFTAPSFGPVHTRVELPGGKVARCRPRRKASYCPHGRGSPAASGTRKTTPAWAGRCARTATTTTAAVVWNAHASELWRRTIITLRRQLAKIAKAHGARVKLSYAKVAEFQRRGLIHFHAIFRLDGIDPVHPERTVPPHPAITADVLADLIRQVAARPGSPPSPIRPSRTAGTSPGAPRSTRASSGSPATARSPTSRSPPTWPSTPPSPPSRSASCPAGSPPRTPRPMRQSSTPPGTADPRLPAGSAATRTRTSRRCAGGRTCSATAATSPPKAAATPPPCARLRAARRDWHRRQHPHAHL